MSLPLPNSTLFPYTTLFRSVSYGIGSRTLFKDILFSVTSGMRVGLVGPNGSGKTTLLRLLRGDIKPESGKIHRAEGLRRDRKSTRLNSSHRCISYAVFCLKK